MSAIRAKSKTTRFITEDKAAAIATKALWDMWGDFMELREDDETELYDWYKTRLRQVFLSGVLIGQLLVISVYSLGLL